jgi:antitoxin CptB
MQGPPPRKGVMTNNEDIAVRRKRLLHRSRYTGMKETDLMLGRFANTYIHDFSSEELDIYEKLLKAGDPSIYAWAVGREDVPEEYATSVMEKLKNFAIYENDPAHSQE